MAEPLESFEFSAQGRAGIYAWDEWLDGRPWKLTKGVDYKVKYPSFINAAHNTARKRGLKLLTQEQPNGCVIQAFKP